MPGPVRGQGLIAGARVRRSLFGRGHAAGVELKRWARCGEQGRAVQAGWLALAEDGPNFLGLRMCVTVVMCDIPRAPDRELELAGQPGCSRSVGGACGARRERFAGSDCRLPERLAAAALGSGWRAAENIAVEGLPAPGTQTSAPLWRPNRTIFAAQHGA